MTILRVVLTPKLKAHFIFNVILFMFYICIYDYIIRFNHNICELASIQCFTEYTIIISIRVSDLIGTLRKIISSC